MSLTPQTALNNGIRLAAHVETAAERLRVQKPIQLVAYGFLERNRRLAIAIRCLGVMTAYEGRMLLRTMIEIMINYRWIRLRRPHSRALRFIAFQPLELLNVHRSLRESMDDGAFEQARRNLESQRRRQRHLFRYRNKKGKMCWANSWASVPSLEARLREVKAAEHPGQPDQFLYALYSWTSSAVHGGPHSIDEVLTTDAGHLRPKRQPERNSVAQLVGAAAALAVNMHAAVEDLGLKRTFAQELKSYAADLEALRRERGADAGRLPNTALHPTAAGEE